MSVLFDPERQHRRSIRLRGYDYTQAGAYFVTIVIQDRGCLFGEVVDDHMRLNDAGRMVAAEWDALFPRFINIDLDAFVVMPNHIHGIIVITGTTGKIATNGSTAVGAPLVGAQSTMGDIVGAPLWVPNPGRAPNHRRPNRGNHKGCPYVRSHDNDVGPRRGPYRRRIQIVDNRCLYARGQNAGMVTVSRAIVAAQLFRTHPSQRGILAPHPSIHRGQPRPLDGRP